MPAPSAFPDWDTNATNTAAIVSGHALDGFVNDEIPTARELNQVFMLLGLWIRYLAKRDSSIRKIAACEGIARLASGSTGGFFEYGEFKAQNAGDELVVPLKMQPGEHLTQVDGLVYDFVSQVWDMQVWKVHRLAANTVQIGTTQSSPGGAGQHTLSVTGLNETITTDEYQYIAKFTVNTLGAGSSIVHMVQVTYDIPAV